ncbi:MAG: uroporphyrinogen-III C-methyltransferase [Myxococcota bacterium]
MSGGRTRRGRVLLVGAGPGDPDLITVRGQKALRSADAVVYDTLASRELLAYARPDAALYDVGKRGHVPPPPPPSPVNDQRVELGGEGKTVVRLKGGDPFVFGRGGEEATACAGAGLDFEVVPGVSSAVAALAYAGIPVTDRRHSASFAVVTGHKDPTRVSEQTRWRELGTAVDTLVILMGMQKLDDLVAQILAGGRAPETPAAAVMNGTLPSQRVVTAPLGLLAARVRQASLGAPAAVVIGDVVRLREQLAWFERLPLFGKRVLVTRDASQSASLVEALRAVGGEAVLAPMIELAPPESWDEVDAALDRQGDCDALLLTSANAARFLALRAAERGVSLVPPGLRVFCVGPQTAAVARAAGIPVHHVPAEPADARALLEEVRRQLPPRGRRFLLPRSERARAELPEGLAADGATVEAVTVYRTLPPSMDAETLRGLLRDPGLDALTFTSPSTVAHFVERLDADSRTAAGRCIVAAIGSVTAEALREAGLAPDVTAERAGVPGLVAVLVDRLSPLNAGGTR